MLKVRNRVLMIAALAISTWPMFANAGVSDADFAKLQRQLNARDTAILDMQNQMSVQEATIRELQGKIDDLSNIVSNLQNTVEDFKKNAKVNVVKELDVPSDFKTTEASKESQKTNISDKGVVAVNNQEQEDYDAAYNFVKTNEFAKAQQLFTQFIKKYPNSSLVANCYYWKGQMFFKDKKYAEAKENFLTVTKFKNSSKRADSVYKLGQIYENQGDNVKASKYYQLVLKSYPDSTEAQLAQNALIKLK